MKDNCPHRVPFACRCRSRAHVAGHSNTMPKPEMSSSGWRNLRPGSCDSGTPPVHVSKLHRSSRTYPQEHSDRPSKPCWSTMSKKAKKKTPEYIDHKARNNVGLGLALVRRGSLHGTARFQRGHSQLRTADGSRRTTGNKTSEKSRNNDNSH